MITLTEAIPVPAAIAASLVVAVAAWRARALSGTGAAAATLVGVLALSVSFAFGAFLIAWFVLAAAISKVGKMQKAERVAGIVEKGGRRDAAQVLANGGVFVLALLGLLLSGTACSMGTHCGLLLSVAAAGSLAAAGADTWATELGTLFGGEPFSIRTGSRVAAGTSGAVTLAGCIAMLAGAGSLALLAGLLTVIPLEARPIIAVAAGGVVGAVADTLIGAWLQERRRCQQCSTHTEQRVHACGSHTVIDSGIAGLNNDAVNALCTLLGAVGAAVMVLL